ncbi:MAG: hypothetical protein AB1414_16210 [bacterium]
MKKTIIKFLLINLYLCSIIFLIPDLVQARITGGTCESCHDAHNPGPNPSHSVIMSSCASCHSFGGPPQYTPTEFCKTCHPSGHGGTPSDTTPPVTTANLTGTLGDNGWYISDVIVELSATDSQSGVKEIHYSVDNEPEVIVTGSLTSTILTSNGIHNITYYAVDTAGNQESSKSLTVNIDKSDITPPVTTANLIGTLGEDDWYVSDVTVELSATDSQSGVQEIHYSVDGEPEVVFIPSQGDSTVGFFDEYRFGNPVSLGSNINSPYIETHPSLTADGNHLYFMSNRPGGYGYGDIYVSHKINGEWQPAENIGFPINTMGDEGEPAISPDGRVLYFTSGGRGSDDVPYRWTRIWRSENINGVWQTPTVLPSNVNVSSINNNLSFITPDGKWLYYAVFGVGYGMWDAYRAEILNNGQNFTVEHLPSPINTVNRDGPVYLSSDGKYFIFWSDRTGIFPHYVSEIINSVYQEPVRLVYPFSEPYAIGTLTENEKIAYLVSFASSDYLHAGDPGDDIFYATVNRSSNKASFNLTTDGIHNIAYYSIDNAGNQETLKNLMVKINKTVPDTTPPVTTANLTGTLGDNGWYTSDVTVDLSATDSESGVQEIHYIVDGEPEVIVTESLASMSFTSNGVHNIIYYAIDNAGIQESNKNLTVNIDKEMPVTTANLTGTLTENNWYVSDVKVELSAADSESGIKEIHYSVDGEPEVIFIPSMPETVTTFYAITPAGGANTLIGFQLDSINNGIIEITKNIPLTLDGYPPNIFTNSLSFSPLTGELYAWSSRSTIPTPATGPFTGQLYKIDRFTGAINLIGAGGEPYWMNGLAFDSNGKLYGIENNLYVIDTTTGARVKVSENPIGNGHRGLAYNFVYNELYAWTGGEGIPDQILKIDTTNGTTTNVPIDFNLNMWSVGTEFDPVTGKLIGLRNGNLVYSVDINTGHGTYLGKLHWDMPDEIISNCLSVLQTYGGTEAGAITLTTDGVHNVTYYAVDNAGNVESTKSLVINIDKAPPTITVSVSPEPNSDGWNNTDVIVSFAAQDDLSGVSTVTEPINVTTEGASQTIRGEATDLAGNSASVAVTLNIDKTPPTITATRSVEPNTNGWNNIDVTVTFSGEDTLAGIGFLTSPITVMAEGASQTVTGQAIDLAGNSATTSLTLNIDKTPPVVNAGADTTFIETETVVLTPTATDNLDPNPAITSDAPGIYPLGNTTVTVTATDHAGNVGSDSLVVTIITAETASEELKAMINALNSSAFVNNANNRKNALSNKINALINIIGAAKAASDPGSQDALFSEAVSKLQNDIQAKMNGCITNGSFDNNDWITDCSAQDQLNVLIDRILTSLNNLRNA